MWHSLSDAGGGKEAQFITWYDTAAGRDTLGCFYTAAEQAAIVAKHGLRIFISMKHHQYKPKKLSATLAGLYESAGVAADVPGCALFI